MCIVLETPLQKNQSLWFRVGRKQAIDFNHKRLEVRAIDFNQKSLNDTGRKQATDFNHKRLVEVAAMHGSNKCAKLN